MRTARVWNVVTGLQIGAALRHDAAILSASFSPDGTGEEDVTDLFKLQDEVVGRLASSLGWALTHAEAEKRSVQKSARLSRFQPLRSPVEPLPNRGRGSALAAHGRGGAGVSDRGGSAVAGHPELMAAAHVTRNGTPYAAAAIARMIA